jgi:hypothetical protein
MFAKTSIALTLIIALASTAVAAPKYNSDNGVKITTPSVTPEGNRDGWFLDR